MEREKKTYSTHAVPVQLHEGASFFPGNHALGFDVKRAGIVLHHFPVSEAWTHVNLLPHRREERWQRGGRNAARPGFSTFQHSEVQA